MLHPHPWQRELFGVGARRWDLPMHTHDRQSAPFERAPRRFLTTAEVAARLQCSRSHVHALIAAGVLPAWKPSPRKTLIPISALDRIEDAVLAEVSDEALERAYAARLRAGKPKGVRDA